jgi:hypothetical protein
MFSIQKVPGLQKATRRQRSAEGGIALPSIASSSTFQTQEQRAAQQLGAAHEGLVDRRGAGIDRQIAQKEDPPEAGVADRGLAVRHVQIQPVWSRCASSQPTVAYQSSVYLPRRNPRKGRKRATGLVTKNRQK